MSEVLITGSCGFVASHVGDALVGQGHKVIGIDNLSTGKLENLNNQIAFKRGDITKQEDIPRRNYDYIFHLAAKARVQNSIKEPVVWNDTNVNGTLNILELARDVGAKVIYSSSSSVYGDAERLPTSEEHPKNPKSPYALQKLIGELYLKLYSDIYDLDYTILRYFNVYGERMIPGGPYSAVIEHFQKAKAEGRPLSITNDGEQRRDFTYVKDVAKANLMAMAWPREAYNIGNGDNKSVNDIADAVGGERVHTDPVVEPRETLADNSKARALGWEPTMNVIDWIKYVNKL